MVREGRSTGCCLIVTLLGSCWMRWLRLDDSSEVLLGTDEL